MNLILADFLGNLGWIVAAVELGALAVLVGLWRKAKQKTRRIGG